MSAEVDIRKSWGDFSLKMQFSAADEIVGLLGESGSGKSMTLRCIAGIVTPDSGRIVVNGRTLFDAEQKINLSPRERRVGLLFQNYALFPNMTVAQNIAAGVHDRRKHVGQTAFYLHLLRLEGLENRYPRQLSGGQQQRTALARMMVGEPEILMLDEPFSALDGHLRREIEPEFTAALAAFHGTVLYVSHDISEIYRYSAKTVMLSAGAVIEAGTTSTLFAQPKTLRGARLLCCKNSAAVEPIDEKHMLVREWGTILPARDCSYVGMYGDDIRLSATAEEGAFPARLEEICPRPRCTVLRLRVENGGGVLAASCACAEAETLAARAVDSRLYVNLPKEKLLYLSE